MSNPANEGASAETCTACEEQQQATSSDGASPIAVCECPYASVENAKPNTPMLKVSCARASESAKSALTTGNDGEEQVESERAEQRECRQDDVERVEKAFKFQTCPGAYYAPWDQKRQIRAQRFYDKIGVLTLSWYLSPWNNTAP